jgi:iron-sulfur cluster assembly accessory protein
MKTKELKTMAEKTESTQEKQLIHLTPAAIQEAKRLISEEKDDGIFLRLGVTTGGCSGFSYTMELDTNASEFDREFDFDGLKVRVDLKALMYLEGATLDFKGGLLGGGFQFDNPKARRSCGCGSSFSC